MAYKGAAHVVESGLYEAYVRRQRGLVNRVAVARIYHDRVVGGSTITLPSSYNELIFEVVVNNNVNLAIYNIPIIKNQLSSSMKRFRIGSLANQGGSTVVIDVSLTSCKLISCLLDNGDVTSNTPISVYYK